MPDSLKIAHILAAKEALDKNNVPVTEASFVPELWSDDKYKQQIRYGNNAMSYEYKEFIENMFSHPKFSWNYHATGVQITRSRYVNSDKIQIPIEMDDAVTARLMVWKKAVE